jgi:hypothetical protein
MPSVEPLAQGAGAHHCNLFRRPAPKDARQPRRRLLQRLSARPAPSCPFIIADESTGFLRVAAGIVGSIARSRGVRSTAAFAQRSVASAARCSLPLSPRRSVELPGCGRCKARSAAEHEIGRDIQGSTLEKTGVGVGVGEENRRRPDHRPRCSRARRFPEIEVVPRYDTTASPSPTAA